VHVTVTAGALGVVHRRIRVADQVNDVVRVLRAGCDADARGDFHFLIADVDRARDLRQHQPRERARLIVAFVRVVPALGEERKFVPRQPADHCLARQGARQALTHGFEDAVAGFVTEGVVDVLEVVEIDVQQHQPAPLTRRARDRLLQQVLKLHAVRDLRERIEACEIADAPLGALAIGDIPQHEDVTLKTGSALEIGEALTATGMVCPPACAHHRLPGRLEDFLDAERLQGALVRSGCRSRAPRARWARVRAAAAQRHWSCGCGRPPRPRAPRRPCC
jgi:hypothetical protein